MIKVCCGPKMIFTPGAEHIRHELFLRVAQNIKPKFMKLNTNFYMNYLFDVCVEAQNIERNDDFFFTKMPKTCQGICNDALFRVNNFQV